jgi:hypothetical protein
MNLLEEILSSDDNASFCEEADSETLKISNCFGNKKRRRYDLEEGEIEDWYTICTGFFFDSTIMKRVPGCAECHAGKFCKRTRRV